MPGADRGGQSGNGRGSSQGSGSSSRGSGRGGGANRSGRNRSGSNRNGGARNSGTKNARGNGSAQRTVGGQGQRSQAGGRSRPNVGAEGVAAGTRPAKAADLTPPTATVERARKAVSDGNGQKPWRGRALAVASIPALVVFVLVVAIGAALGQVLIALVIAFVLGAGVWAAVWLLAPRLLLARLGGRPVEEDDVPRAANLVDGLCATMGLPLPALTLIDDPFRGALAIGRNERTATLVLTTGLLRALDPVELEGVLAHELSHVKSGDMASATMAATVVLPLAPMITGSPELVRRLAGPGRELAADQRAYAVTRYPPGLRDALVKMTSGPPPAPPSALASSGTGRVLRWVWTVVPELLTPRTTVGILDAPATRVAALDEA